MTELTVTIPDGTVRGRRTGPDVRAFLGVPYAQPPEGDLRFAAPVPVEPWTGVRDSTAWSAVVPQPRAVIANMSLADPGDDRDCLTVNVWTPAVGTEQLPVMVWFHGGAYRGGSGNADMFEGTDFATQGHVVCVVANTRTGPEGYTEIPGAPSNRGLLDALAALSWVKESISSFGGDPQNVTIFGQSSGAGVVASLLAMAGDSGLFHRAIGQSVPRTFFTRELAVDVARELASVAGCEPTIEGFSSVNALDLADCGEVLARRLPEFKSRWGQLAYTPTVFSPVVEPDTLPRLPWEAVASGSTDAVDLLVGHTSDEYRVFTPLLAPNGVSDEAMDEVLRVFAPHGDAEPYLDLLRADGHDLDNVDVFDSVNADWEFRMASALLADARPPDVETWLYEFAYPSPVVGCAPHSGELAPLWGHEDPKPHRRYYPDPLDAPTLNLGSEVRQAWWSFARIGDPGWPPYQRTSPIAMVFDEASSARDYPLAGHLELARTDPPRVLDLLD